MKTKYNNKGIALAIFRTGFSFLLILFMPIFFNMQNILASSQDAGPVWDGSQWDDYKKIYLLDQSSAEGMREMRLEPPTVNLRWENGRLFVKYSYIYNELLETSEPYFRITGDVLTLSWTPKNENDYGEYHKEIYNIEFTVPFEGKIELKRNLKRGRYVENPDYITLYTFEGMDQTVRLFEKDFLPLTDSRREWLYGMTKNGVLLDSYATERFVGKEIIEGKEYDLLYHCDGKEFDMEKAYPLAYVREDGLNYYVVPATGSVDPASVWTLDMTDPVAIDAQESMLYSHYNNSGIAIMKDYGMDSFGMQPVTEIKYHRDYSIRENAGGSVKDGVSVCQPLYRQSTLGNGMLLIEGVGVVGEGSNSVAMPSVVGIGEDKSAMKLIECRVHKDVSPLVKDDDLHAGFIFYRDEELHFQFRMQQGDVEEIGVNSTVLRYSDGYLHVAGDGPKLLSVYSPDGKIVMRTEVSAPAEISLGDLSTGVYIAESRDPEGSTTLRFVKR